MRMLVLGITLVSFLLTSACSTFQPIEGYTPAKARKEVSIGDDVEIVIMSGQTLFMEVTAMDAHAIKGVYDHRNYVIEWSQIKSMQHKRFSPGISALVGVYTVYVGSMVLTLLAFMIVADRLSKAQD